MDPAPSTPDPRSAFLARLASLSLIVVTALFGFVSVILLASTLIQTRLVSLGIDGVNMSIGRLNLVRQDYRILLGNKDEASAGLRATQRERRDVNDKLEALESRFRDTRAEVLRLLRVIRSRLEAIDAELANSLATADAEQVDIAKEMGVIESARDKLRSHAQLAPDLQKLFLTHGDYVAALEPKSKLASELRKINDEVTALTERIGAADQGLKKLFEDIKASLDENARSRIVSSVHELNIMERSYASRLLFQFVVLQPDLLTLCLVICMGVLGSCLQMTHAYYKGDAPRKIGSYFLRLSVGAMAALVIFIVAKAGVPVLADPSRLGGDATINPYFISFLAIISGLLSENAIANIQAQGARLFGGDDRVDRWTRRDITQDLEQQNLAVESLATHLGHDETSVRKMLKGEEKISPADQKLIAIAVRGSPRDLFTDIPPS